MHAQSGTKAHPNPPPPGPERPAAQRLVEQRAARQPGEQHPRDRLRAFRGARRRHAGRQRRGGRRRRGDRRYVLRGAVPTLPAPAAAHRGKIVRVEGRDGAADGLFICEKDAAGGYAWRKI